MLMPGIQLSVLQTLTAVLLVSFWCEKVLAKKKVYSMGCDCGLRVVDEEKEKDCQESAMMESMDNV